MSNRFAIRWADGAYVDRNSNLFMSPRGPDFRPFETAAEAHRYVKQVPHNYGADDASAAEATSWFAGYIVEAF